MKRLLTLVAALALTATAAFAQTPPIDDCPAGHTLHRSLTGLDYNSMLQAYTASFVGLFHRQPSMQPGSGADDGNYWINVSNHYGLYGDDVCRAGWNLYREKQLGSIPTGPIPDADLPASFLPGSVPSPTPTPTPVPVPVPTPVPVPSADLTPILNAINNVSFQIQALSGKVDTSTQQIVDAVNEPSWYRKLATNQYVQMVGAALATYVATKKIGG